LSQGVLRSEAGYSLIEMMGVVGIVAILGSMSAWQIASTRPGYQTDGAMRVVMAELNAARDTAVSQRREVRVDFDGVDTLTVTRIEEPSGETELRRVQFEAGVEFGFVDGAGDTPDGFGLDAPDTIRFNSDGMVINANGDPVNHSLFLLRPGAPESLRAVTVLGSTGRVRAYRWYGDDKWSRI
jgi:Tfp pilus assembly protein FimT